MNSVIPNFTCNYGNVLCFALLGPAVHKHQFNSNAVTDINLDNVCKKGNTLLWDIVQDDDAVSYIIKWKEYKIIAKCNQDKWLHIYFL